MVRRRFFSAVSNHEDVHLILRNAAKTPLLKDEEVAPSW
jgi:hypothetical protein